LAWLGAAISSNADNTFNLILSFPIPVHTSNGGFVAPFWQSP
jgi:hypothetical protein